MQTFLPLPSFLGSLSCLDSRRLGKQRVEAMQLLRVLDRFPGRTTGWASHPAARMWEGHRDALALYHNCSILVWVSRGYRCTMAMEPVGPEPTVPWWFGDEQFHASHRSNLLRKDRGHYGQFGWAEPDSLPYVWPSASPPIAALPPSASPSGPLR